MRRLQYRLESLFEVGGRGRLMPMEGVRGIAVGLVFLQHYCTQFLEMTDISGPTREIATFFRSIGNYGVELFFVLSGFLIYSILARKHPQFFDFMVRRLERLYPAFLVALLIGALLDPWRGTPKIPLDLVDGPAYIAANLAFLPGLFPIDPLFAVNWSLSYEWWFYTVCALFVSVFGLGALPSRWRVTGIFAVGALMIGLSAAGVDHVPIRGLCLVAGMLLAEAHFMKWSMPPGLVAVPAALAALFLCYLVSMPAWGQALILAVAFYLFCGAAFLRQEETGKSLGTALSAPPLRWFGNMSYSYYLIHGFVIVIASNILLPRLTFIPANILFWGGMPPIFLATLVAGATLFLGIEKPFSLRQRKSKLAQTPAT
ncbi:MAG: acyltransferase family protein [Magnetospiraceae bacterium]